MGTPPAGTRQRPVSRLTTIRYPFERSSLQSHEALASFARGDGPHLRRRARGVPSASAPSRGVQIVQLGDHPHHRAAPAHPRRGDLLAREVNIVSGPRSRRCHRLALLSLNNMHALCHVTCQPRHNDIAHVLSHFRAAQSPTTAAFCHIRGTAGQDCTWRGLLRGGADGGLFPGGTPSHPRETKSCKALIVLTNEAGHFQLHKRSAAPKTPRKSHTSMTGHSRSLFRERRRLELGFPQTPFRR